MLGNYVSPKVATCEKKEEISKTIKKNDDITLSNSSSADDKADDENERIRKGLTKIFKEMKEADREYEEKLIREGTDHYNSLFMYK